MPVEDTSKDPHPEWLGGRNPRAIEAQERAGQSQLVADNSILPRKCNDFDGSTERKLLGLGFNFGEPVDDLFRKATLPPGWEKDGSDHAMWSYVVDDRGIQRVSVFYKAAFYDRDAFMNIVNVGGNLGSKFMYDESEIPWDKLTVEEINDVREHALGYLENIKRHPDIYGDRKERAEKLRGLAEETRVMRSRATSD